MTSTLVTSVPLTLTSDEATVLKWLTQLNATSYREMKSCVGCVSHMAHICLLKYWSKPVDDGFELQEIDAFWHADVTWFGKDFPSKLRADGDIVYVSGGVKQEMQALALFSRHLVQKFEKLYLRLQLWLGTANDLRINIGLLQPFYVIRDYLEFPNFEQRETALEDLYYAARTLDHLSEVPVGHEWRRDLQAGGDIVATLGGALIHFECRESRPVPSEG